MSADLDLAHDALNRMKRAHERGTGCHLTWEMVAALSVSIIGQMWCEPDPRDDLSPPLSKAPSHEHNR